jgi:hypothetical protein
MVFSQQEQGFVGELPFDATGSQVHAVLDINGDGFLDIVFAFWGGLNPSENGTNVGDRPVPNEIAIFINQDGDHFSDLTSDYLSGETDIGGATRKVEIVDLNEDGKMDLVFTVNREDGRSGDPLEFVSSQSAALLSDADQYRIVKFGPPDWFHNTAVGTLDGSPFVINSGFAGSAADRIGFGFVAGAISQVVEFPFRLSPNTAKFLSSIPGGDSDLLVQTQQFPNLLGLEAWVRTGSDWSLTSQIDNPYTFVKNVRFVNFNETITDNVPIFHTGTDFILGGGGFAITESKQINLGNSPALNLLVKFEAPIVPNFSVDLTEEIRADELIANNQIILMTVTNGILTSSPITIDGEFNDLNYSFFSARDIDRDGLEDIIVFPYTFDGAPVVYLNQGAGGFDYQPLNTTSFFQYHRDAANSTVADFDNDGIFDIVTWPANGNDLAKGRSMEDFIYYKGCCRP